jgi:hypothetical protein
VDPELGTALATVTGTVAPLSGALPESLRVTLSPVTAANGRTVQQSAAPKGQFRFEGVAAGAWELAAEADGTAYPVVAVAANGQNHAGGGLTVRDKPVRVAATIAAGGTRIEGVARKGAKGVAGVMVVLIPGEAGALHSMARRDQSDSDGSFALRDVPPGQYTVVAIENGWEMDWGLKGALDRYLPGGVSVRVTGATGKLVRLEKPVTVQPR